MINQPAIQLPDGRPPTTIRSLATERLAAAIAERDAQTADHGHRVVSIGLAVLRYMCPRTVEDPATEVGFLLHDIGKIVVPDRILHKPGPLSFSERVHMRRHPALGAKIVEDLRGMDIRAIVRHHHERWDGRGYPDRIGGTAIPVAARALAVADTFDAICSDRPYRAGRPVAAAMDEIRRASGTQFDPDAVRALSRIL